MQTSGHHALVTNSDSGRLPVRQTPHLRAHCKRYRYDKWSLTRQRFSIARLPFSLTRKRKTGHIHTAWQAVTKNAAFDPPGHNFSTFQSSALYATSEASFFLTDLRLYSSSASCKRWYGNRFGSRSHHKDQFLRQCHLVTQASPEFKNFPANTNSSRLLSTSHRWLRQIKVPLSPSLTY